MARVLWRPPRLSPPHTTNKGRLADPSQTPRALLGAQRVTDALALIKAVLVSLSLRLLRSSYCHLVLVFRAEKIIVLVIIDMSRPAFRQKYCTEFSNSRHSRG
ncbi:hypothetical protein NDU88_004428 [Pleurodeles waltl]|uniref:Uncharacterized protein n=1 Tax=Pleurodeles waltl TaxID=8319 RepID=A0AAV7LII7_PLEWA|nr:hypothetical protein NDU88_004428 [Pleurodeles waltl]